MREEENKERHEKARPAETKFIEAGTELNNAIKLLEAAIANPANANAKATPLLLILFCVSRNLWLSVALLGLLGAAQILFRTVSRLIIQVEAPRELLGRVMSVFLMDQGLRSVGSMVMGSLATIFGAALGLSLCSVLSMALTGVTFYRVLGKPKARPV